MDPSRERGSAKKDVVPTQEASLVGQKRSAGAVVSSGPSASLASGAASVNRGKFGGLCERSDLERTTGYCIIQFREVDLVPRKLDV